jgi:hypothetical protein
MSKLDETSEFPYEPSTIENVDMAVYNWLNESLDLSTNTNAGFQKVPVIWVTGERSWQVKNRKELRNTNNTFILPVITLERTEINKEVDKKGKYWADIRPIRDTQGGSLAIHRVIKQDKTSNFANAISKRKTKQPNFKRENDKVVYQTKFIPMPVYVTMKYTIDIKTEYQQQMNDLTQPFLTFPGGVNYFVVENEGHRYEAFVDGSFSLKNNGADLQENERLFNTQLTIRVLAHLVGKGVNDEKPKVSVRENIVEVKIPREYVIFGDNFEGYKAAFPDTDAVQTSNGNFILTSDGKYILVD